MSVSNKVHGLGRENVSNEALYLFHRACPSTEHVRFFKATFEDCVTSKYRDRHYFTGIQCSMSRSIVIKSHVPILPSPPPHDATLHGSHSRIYENTGMLSTTTRLGAYTRFTRPTEPWSWYPEPHADEDLGPEDSWL